MNEVSQNITTSNSNTTSIDVWCHTCERFSTADLNTNINEYECSSCGANFVEGVGQNLERFYSAEDSNTDVNENSTVTIQDDESNVIEDENGLDIIQHVLNNILGLGVQVRPRVQSTLLHIMQQAASDSGRPIGIVVRQPVTAEESDNISSILSASNSNRRGVQRNSNNDENSRTSQSLRNSFGGILAFAGSDFLDGPGNLGLNGRSFEDLLHHILMNEAGVAGPPPTSSSTLETLPRTIIQKESEIIEFGGSCSISQETFVIGDNIIHLPCGHHFKDESIVQWLNMHNTCPVCRITIE